MSCLGEDQAWVGGWAARSSCSFSVVPGSVVWGRKGLLGLILLPRRVSLPPPPGAYTSLPNQKLGQCRPVSAVCHWGGKSGWVGISLYLKGTWKLRSPEIWYCPSLFLPLNQAEDGGPWAARQWLLRKAGHLSRSGQPSIRSGLGRAGPWVRALPRRGTCMGGGCHTSRLLGGLYV